MADPFLKKLGLVLSDDGKRRRLFEATWRLIGRISAVLVYGSCAMLIGLLLLFRWTGEANLFFAFLLYLPRHLWLLPVGFLLPLALVFRRRLLVPLAASILVFLISGMDWRPAPNAFNRTPPERPSRSVRVLTYNRGQHMNQSLQPFKDRVQPDIIAFQEAGNRANRYLQAEGYEAFHHGADVGEFTLLSRFPIRNSAPVEIVLGSQTSAPAARFEIDFEGTPLALYSVHVISPRDTLSYYRRGAFLYGILGWPGTPWNEKRRANQQFWDARIAEARELLRKIDAETLPVIVVGDFNAPAGGLIHGVFSNGLQDAHREAGSGFGYTFPGVTRNPLSLGGPWMRIDYLFGDRDHWEVEWCLTEPERPSQHRAVAAQFRLLGSGSGPDSAVSASPPGTGPAPTRSP